MLNPRLLPDHAPQAKTTHITQTVYTSSFPPFLNTNDAFYNRRETVIISDSESDMDWDTSRDSMLIDSVDMDMKIDTSAHCEATRNSYASMEVDELAQGMLTHTNPQNGPSTHENGTWNSNTDIHLGAKTMELLLPACEVALVEKSMQSLRLTAAPSPILSTGPIFTPISHVPKLNMSAARAFEINNNFSSPLRYLPEGPATSLAFDTTPPSLKRLQDKFFGNNELDYIANGIQGLGLGSPSVAAWVPPDLSSSSPSLSLAPEEEFLASPSRSALAFDSLDFENLDFSRPDAEDGPLHSTPLSDDGCPSFGGVQAESVDWDAIFSTNAGDIRGTEPYGTRSPSSRSPERFGDSAKLEDGARVSFGTDRTFVTFSSGLLGEFIEVFNLPPVDRKEFPPHIIIDTGLPLKDIKNLAESDDSLPHKMSPKLSEWYSIKYTPSRPLPSRHISENILSSSRRYQFHEAQDISSVVASSRAQASFQRPRIPRSISANGPLFEHLKQNSFVAKAAPHTPALPPPPATKYPSTPMPIPTAAAGPAPAPPERGTLTVTQSIKNLVHHLAEAESIKNIASHLVETEKTITKVLKEQVFPGAFPEEAEECVKGKGGTSRDVSGTRAGSAGSWFSRIALLVFSW